MAHKERYQDGEALVCSSCKTVMRFTDLEGRVAMFPLGGSMTTVGEQAEEKKPEKIEVHFFQAYGGGTKPTVKINGVEYLIEVDWLTKYLEKQIDSKGYTTSISGQQKYPRLKIND